MSKATWVVTLPLWLVLQGCQGERVPCDAGDCEETAGASSGGSGAQPPNGSAGSTVGGQASGDPAGSSFTPDLVSEANALCAQQETGLFKPETQQDFEMLMSRAWLRCEGAPIFAREDAGGFEISNDGTWRFLLPEGEGLVRGQGFENEGTWDVSDTSSMNGPGYYQLNLNRASGGSGYFATFSTTPAKVFLTSMAGDTEYAPLP